jgi:hypothetical protein
MLPRGDLNALSQWGMCFTWVEENLNILETIWIAWSFQVACEYEDGSFLGYSVMECRWSIVTFQTSQMLVYFNDTTMLYISENCHFEVTFNTALLCGILCSYSFAHKCFVFTHFA